MALVERKTSTAVSKVIGPIRCHKCRQVCRDADHYLNHECVPKGSLALGLSSPKFADWWNEVED